MKTWIYLFTSLILLIGLTACGAASVKSVGDAYMEAVEAGDSEAMLARVSDDVVLVVDGGAIFQNELAGKEAIREYMAGNASAGFRLERTGATLVAGNQITYPDRFALNEFQALGVDWVAGQDVLTIEQGQVVRDVWTIDPAAEQALQEAILRATVIEWTQATNDQNLERCLVLVTDEIERVVIGDPFFHSEVSGKADFAAALQEEMALHMRVEHPAGPAGMQVVGYVVTTPSRFGLDPFRAVGVEWVYGTDEITFSNGKISRHVFTISEESAAELGAAFAAQEQGLTPEELEPDGAGSSLAQRAFYAQQMASEAALERWSAPQGELPAPETDQLPRQVLNGVAFE